MLQGVRVLDRSSEIAGPYCAKLLVDAGADVVKVETGSGDPLRRWRSGGLFEFLNASKRAGSPTDDALVAGADILVLDEPVDVAALRGEHPGLVIVTITPFGLTGPWAGRPATEFTLQAWCGSTGNRGVPEGPPLAAGGRLGEWIAGTYAALGAVAAWTSARRCGAGEHVDVALLDCMAVAMTTYPTVFADFLGWPRMRGTGRTTEVPSVARTADGSINYTTNSAQQIKDFFAMIGRLDLADDPRMAFAPERFRRRDELNAIIEGHTAAATTADLLDEAAAWRVPAGPVLNGASAPEFEQFVARTVYAPAPSGRFRQPRVPYRISGVEQPAPAPAPAPGDVAPVHWEPRPAPPPADWPLPLDGVRIVDCTAWWAGPASTHILACLGADVIKVESPSRPDGMRMITVKPPTADEWWEWGPLYHGVNVGKRAVTLDLTRAEGLAALERLLDDADVFIENFTPRVMDNFGLAWERVHERHPRLLMVRMPAFGLDGPWRDRTGFAQTMEAVSGMAWVTGEPDGPPILVRGACDPLAGAHAALAVLVALATRENDGDGHLVEVPMVEAALNVAAEQVIEFDAAGTLLSRTGNRLDGFAPQGVYRGAGEDNWIAISVATDEQWRALRAAIGNPSWAADETLASAAEREAAHDAIDHGLAAWFAARDVARAVELLTAAGVPAGVVVAARDIAHNPQLQARGLFEPEDHRVTGRHDIPGLPVRFSRVDRWARGAAPTLGEHNDEVLGAALGKDALDELRAAGVAGETLAGA